MKKWIATVLALVLALGLCSVSWAEETGYKNQALPTAPDMSGAVVEVNAENAQYTLDGAYGSINGKTIKFTESITDVLVLGRPTKYAGSNTKYYSENFMTEIDYAGALAVATNGRYARAVSGVTFTAGTNVTLAGFTLDGATGHIHGTPEKPVYDYVRDSGTECVDNNKGYFANLTLENITFDGLTVNSTSGFAFYFMTTSVNGAQNKVDGLTFKDCKITSSDKGITDFMNNGGTADIFSNITFDNCELTVSGSNQANTYGVYTQGISNVTVNKCKLTGMTRAIQNVAGGAEGNVQQPSGTFTVTDNEFSGITAYIIRGESTAALTDLTVTGNTSRDSGADSKIKFGEAQSYEGSGKTAIYSNSWDGNVSHTDTWSQDTEAPQPEQKPSGNHYYYYTPSTDTTETKGSPKTFDAGIALYVGMAVTSAAGLAYSGKRKF